MRPVWCVALTEHGIPLGTVEKCAKCPSLVAMSFCRFVGLLSEHGRRIAPSDCPVGLLRVRMASQLCSFQAIHPTPTSEVLAYQK